MWKVGGLIRELMYAAETFYLSREARLAPKMSIEMGVSWKDFVRRGAETSGLPLCTSILIRATSG